MAAFYRTVIVINIEIFLSVILLDDDEAHKTGCSYSLLDPAFLIAILGFQAIQL